LRGSPEELAAGLKGYPFSQLEVDCAHRVDKLVALGRVPSAGAPCDSMNLNSEMLRDRNAAFMIYYAVAGDSATNLKYFVDLETRLLLSRSGTEADTRELFGSFGKCVAMETTLREAGKWNDATSQPSRDIREEIEAMMHFEPGHYERQKPAKWWTEFYTTSFENAIPLLSDREVLLKSGVAYFHGSKLLQQFCGIKITEFVATTEHTLIRNSNEQKGQVDWLCDSIVARLRRAWQARFGGSGRAQDAGIPANLRHLLQLESVFNTVMQRAPLCMASLLLKLRESHGRGFKAGLENKERNVLMTFLQASGVERQATMTLFWDLAGLDEKSFQNKYGKSIDYFYNKAYKSFGCSKIQETGLCPFQSKNRALELAKTAKVTVDIEECFKSNPPPCVSCSLYYKTCQGSGWKQTVIHNPKTYFVHAIGEAATAKRARAPDGEAGAPAAKRAPLTDEQKTRIEKNRQTALERRRLHTEKNGVGS
jgi:hypothetical protein